MVCVLPAWFWQWWITWSKTPSQGSNVNVLECQYLEWHSLRCLTGMTCSKLCIFGIFVMIFNCQLSCKKKHTAQDIQKDFFCKELIKEGSFNFPNYSVLPKCWNKLCSECFWFTVLEEHVILGFKLFWASFYNLKDLHKNITSNINWLCCTLLNNASMSPKITMAIKM